MLDRQPVLVGPTVRLRPLVQADWDALYGVARDRLIWEQHPAHDRWEEPVFRAFFDDALSHKGALVIMDRQTDAVIGSSRFQGMEQADGGSVEIGWTFLAREYWGGGTNAEVKRLMIGHALGCVAQCRFAVGEDNWRSRKAMEKIGGRLSTRIEERVMAAGSSNHVFYIIDRDDFARGPLAAPIG